MPTMIKQRKARKPPSPATRPSTASSGRNFYVSNGGNGPLERRSPLPGQSEEGQLGRRFQQVGGRLCLQVAQLGKLETLMWFQRESFAHLRAGESDVCCGCVFSVRTWAALLSVMVATGAQSVARRAMYSVTETPSKRSCVCQKVLCREPRQVGVVRPQHTRVCFHSESRLFEDSLREVLCRQLVVRDFRDRGFSPCWRRSVFHLRSTDGLHWRSLASWIMGESCTVICTEGAHAVPKCLSSTGVRHEFRDLSYQGSCVATCKEGHEAGGNISTTFSLCLSSGEFVSEAQTF